RPPVSGRATTSGRRGLLTWLPGPTGAVAQRCLTYWRRDPRYALSVVMVVVLPLLGLVLVLAGFMSLEMWALGLAPVIAFFLGWGLHNDLAYDADPWWLHLAAHVPGRVDRAGRVLGWAVWGLPLVVAAAVAGGLLADRGDMVPALVCTGVAGRGAGVGVSPVAAVCAPWRAPGRGGTPTAVPPGVGRSGSPPRWCPGRRPPSPPRRWPCRSSSPSRAAPRPPGSPSAVGSPSARRSPSPASPSAVGCSTAAARRSSPGSAADPHPATSAPTSRRELISRRELTSRRRGHGASGGPG